MTKEEVRKQIEAVGNHVQLQPFSYGEASREPQVHLEESRGNKRVAPEVAIATQRRRNTRDSEGLAVVQQADGRHCKRHAMNEVRGRSSTATHHRRTAIRGAEVQAEVRASD